MPAITHGSRLDRLRALRDRVDSEIRSIEKARAQIGRVDELYGIHAPASLVRAWAVHQGIAVGTSGRLPKRVREQYDAACRKAAS